LLTVTFAGAARTVTGSQYYLQYTPDAGGKPFRFCIDSGMFQVGQKVNLFKVNSHLIFDPRLLDCVVLTHAHLDHCGRLPYLVKRGFGGKIYSTRATREITEVTLMDAAALSKNDPSNPDYFFPVKGFRKIDVTHQKDKFISSEVANEILPYKLAQANYGLYDQGDVEITMSRFKTFEYHSKFLIHNDLEIEFMDAGHILGSAFVIIHHIPSGKKIIFSGDLGNLDKPIIEDPEFPRGITSITHIFTETTYGNRLHGQLDPKQKLREMCYKPLKSGGKVFIPSFSIERAQEVIYFLVELMRENKLPQVPIFLDSPMAQKVLEIALDHPELYDDEMAEKIKTKAHPLIYQQLKYYLRVKRVSN
jgi:metallo-beta-lactamase family protein